MKIEQLSELDWALDKIERLTAENDKLSTELYNLKNMTFFEKFKKWVKSENPYPHYNSTEYFGGILSTRPEGKYNAWGYTLDLFFLRIWSLEHCSFELAAVADTHWGIGITAILPYTRIVLSTRCPIKFACWFSDKTQRKGKIQIERELKELTCREKELENESQAMMAK